MDFPAPAKKYFTTRLMAWHATGNDRSLPWKSEKDPYKIWLSEVILQQTRAQQGLPYYLRFVDAFPTIRHMAAAGDDVAFRLWQGLGYYNRCRNMLATARYINKELNGVFPNTYDGLLSLKGIGPYTAAAISSFAYGLPNAVVDGNVYRVLSRYFGIDTPFDTTEGKKLFAALAAELLNEKDSAAYNQAIMDMGATVCTPRNPSCTACPLQKKCIAYQNNITGILPVKSKKQVVRNRHFNYLIFTWRNKLWIHKRADNDIWANLYEPYLIETNQQIDLKQLIKHTSFTKINAEYISADHVSTEKQRLTHQLIEFRFFHFRLKKKPDNDIEGGIWVGQEDIEKTPFPRTLISFLKNNLYF